MEILQSLIILLLVAVLFGYLFLRIKIPPVVGFIAAGALLGPGGIGLIRETEGISLLAEIGIVLLLFVIGIEFSHYDLSRIKRVMVFGGGLQVFLTIVAVLGITMLFGSDWQHGLFYGMLVALSSTAIVLKLFSDQGELDTPHGNLCLGVLIFQDMAIIPMLIILPFLAGTGSGEASLIIVLKAAAFIIFIVLAGRYALEPILRAVANTGRHELFLLTIVVLCLLTAELAHEAGLSPAIGAFLAGLLVSRSEYSYQALGHIMPFRDTFSNLFFVVVGMLLNIHVLLDNFWLVSSLVFSILLMKLLAMLATGMIIGYPSRTALISSFSLAQIGEFSFIMAAAGLERGMINSITYQIFIVAAAISMIFAPITVYFSFFLAARFNKSGLLYGLDQRLQKSTDNQAMHELSGHVIICGAGQTGQIVAKALSLRKIRYLLVDLDANLLNTLRAQGLPVMFGDASQLELLKLAGIYRARMVVVSLSDMRSTLRVVEHAARLNPMLHIIVRSRYMVDTSELYHLGAQEVVAEEFEAATEMVYRILNQYLTPDEEIEEFIEEMRQENYAMLRILPKKGQEPRWEQFLADIATDFYFVAPGSAAVGETIRSLDMQQRFGITVAGIYRDGELDSNPQASDIFEVGDTVVVVGMLDKIREASSIFN